MKSADVKPLSVLLLDERNKDRLDKFSTQLKLSQVEENRTVSCEVTVYNFKGLAIVWCSSKGVSGRNRDFVTLIPVQV